MCCYLPVNQCVVFSFLSCLFSLLKKNTFFFILGCEISGEIILLHTPKREKIPE
jgi:hypothetical protein